MLNEFIMQDINKFNPTQIVISCSGTGIIKISDEHFIRMCRLFAVATKRKVMLVPNFSARLGGAIHSDDQYDNFVQFTHSISEACDIDLMRKISIFLKISSGTYNLEFP